MTSQSNHLQPATAPVPHERSLGPVAWMLLISGAVALVYEVVWQREFALLFGSSGPATAAVLAAYFAGLGLGALLVGRWGKHTARPLRWYAVLEAGVGAGALLVSPLLSVVENGYGALFANLSAHAGWFLALKTTFAFVALLLPTFCMGGTLPLLGALVDEGRKHLGLTAGWLYVVNTLGAGLGALAFPFLLFQALGLNGATWLCAAINFGLALTAWVWDARTGPSSQPAATEPAARPKYTPPSDRAPVPIVLPALISGVVTFSLQVLWNRAFAQVHENSMYSFAIIVAVVIFSLALGAQLARLGLRRGLEPRRLVGGAWLLAGAVLALSPWGFLESSHSLAYLPASDGWAGHARHLVVFAAAFLAVPFSLLGIGLPALMEQAGRDTPGNPGRVLGRVLAVNVAGSVLGALVAGFIMPRFLGLWGSMLSLGALVGAAGLWQWPRWKSVARRRAAGAILTAVWVVSLLPLSRVSLALVSLDTARDEQLLSLEEGTHGIVAVVERPGSRRLKLNNHYGLGGTASTGDERIQGHLPLLLHPAPRRVAFLGLGTGSSAGAALFHPVESLTVVELVPEVVTAARTFFKEANRGVLEAPITRVVADDARHFLRGSGETFDVIVGDLVVPWRQGEGALLTLEQFQAARAALAPGGLYCQWLPLFQLSEEEVEILTRTFLQVFPKAQVWRGDFSPTEPALALIGTADHTPWNTKTLSRRVAELRPDPLNPQLQTAEGVWMNLVGELRRTDTPAGNGRLNSENLPWVELIGPRLHSGENNLSLFTGRPLQAWLKRVTLASGERLKTLPDQARAAVEAGDVLAELTLCLSENNETGAEAAQQRLKHLLPNETYRQLFP